MKDKINKLIQECVAPDIQDRYFFETISRGYSAKLYSNVLVNIDISMQAKNRITFKGNEKLKNLIPSSFKTLIKYEETEKKSIPIYIIDTEKSENSLLKALRDLKDVIVEQQEWIFNQHPAETPFGCCGHYEECSDKGFCIQYSIDRTFYKGCEYKKNLEAGKIFYGKHKNNIMNIDSNLTLEEENNNPYANKGKSLLQLPSDYTIFDLETTGLCPDWFEIIEMSAIRVRNNQIVDTYTQLVKPDDEIPPEATAVNHITNKMVANSPKIKEVLKDFLDFLGDDIVMGHNVNFDIHFVYLNAENCYGQYFTNNYIDTMRISRRLFKTEKHHRLKDLIERFKLGGKQEHRALSDCHYTKKVFDWMVSYIKENNIDTKELFRIYKKKKTYTKYDFKNLIATEEINEDNPFFGKDVCFTGALEKYTRNDAAQIIINCGGHPQNSVNKETDFLIVGDTDFREKTRKMEEAYKKQQKGQDIEIIPESMFYQMLNDSL